MNAYTPAVCTEQLQHAAQVLSVASLPLVDGTSWSCVVWGSFHATSLLPSRSPTPSILLYFSSISFLFVSALAKLYIASQAFDPCQYKACFPGFLESSNHFVSHACS
jgi:hypothetical protein